MNDKIYILGYYGYGSLGDDAMRLGITEILRYKGYHNIRCHAKGKGYWANFLWADVVVIGGGTHLRNWGNGAIKQAIRIFGLGLLSKMCGKKFYMLNVGIDGDTLEFLGNCVADKLTIRDRDSFDSSIVIEYEAKPKKKILGVCLGEVVEPYYKNEGEDFKIATNIANKINEWLDKNPEWEVKFFNFNRDDEDINGYADSIVKRSEFRYYSDVESTLNDVSECSAFIGMRYHSLVFAYKTNTPLMVINSYPSCTKFAEFAGVNSVDLEDVLSNKFELYFTLAKLTLNTAKSLAFKGVEL